MDNNTEGFLQRLRFANFINEEIKELLMTRGTFVSHKKIFSELSVDFVDMGFKTQLSIPYRFGFLKIDKVTGLIVQPGSGMYNRLTDEEKKIKYDDFIDFCIASAMKKWIISENKKAKVTVL